MNIMKKRELIMKIDLTCVRIVVIIKKLDFLYI